MSYKNAQTLDKLNPIMNENKHNDYGRSKIYKEFGGCKSDISQNYCAVGRFCVYAFNYGYLVFSEKT